MENQKKGKSTKSKKVINPKATNKIKNSEIKVMEPRSIKAEFTKHIKRSMNSENPQFEFWYCGITNNIKRRNAEQKKDKGPIKYLKFLEAPTQEKANEVEKYFSNKKTINSPNIGGAKPNSRFVYIFKVSKNYVKTQGLAAPNLIEEILNNLFR